MREYFHVLFVYLFVDLVGFGSTDMVHVAHHVLVLLPSPNFRLLVGRFEELCVTSRTYLSQAKIRLRFVFL